MAYRLRRSRGVLPSSASAGSLVRLDLPTTAFLIAAIGFASGSLGVYRSTFSQSLALLFAGVASECILRKHSEARFALRGLVYLLLVGGVLLPGAQLAALAGVLFLLYAETSRRATPDGALLAWATALATTVIVTYVLSSQPYVWVLYSRTCLAFVSHISEFVVGRPLQLAPSYMGHTLLLCYLLVNCFRATQQPSLRSRLRALATGLIPLAFVPTLYVLVGGASEYFQGRGGSVDVLLDAAGTPPHYESLWQHIFPNRVAFLFLPMLLASEHAFAARPTAVTENCRPLPSRRWFATAAGVVVATTLVVLLLNWPRDITHARSTAVYLWDPGNALARPPQPGQPGAGFFAKLPILLEALGYRVVPIDTESQLNEITGHDILVLTNLPDDFPDSLIARVHAFVADGGGLLCLGDHTGFEAIRVPFGKILRPYGIAFNFDSAKPFGTWRTGLLQFHDHVYVDPYPSPASIRSDGIGTGASLEVTFPGKPVIVGQYCFSDPGVETNRKNGFLGNLSYDFGERLGDLILVAEGGGCAGRVLAFGDTSPFQNGAIQMSFGLIARTFEYLSGDAPPVRMWIPQVILLIAAAGVVMVPERSWPTAALVLMSLVTTLGWTWSFHRTRSPWQYVQPGSTQNVAMLIQSQHSSMCPWSHTGSGIGGVDFALLRNRVVALSQSCGLDSLDRVRLAFLLDPHKPLSAGDANSCLKFMESGGSLIVATNYDSQAALHALFQRVGVELRFDPLGHFRGTARLGETDHAVEFVAAWPMEVAPVHTAICKAWTRDVIVEVPVGKGRLIVVGDGRFFTEKNSEGPRMQPKPENAKFVQELIAYCLKP